ncbi:MAG: VanZ family protein [Clostridia bacterium]|nr:VanZ family protein [Clostridia bacterium]
MSERIKKFAEIALFEIISAVVISYSVVPGFNNIGHLLFQVSITALIVIGFLFVVDSKKITPVTVSHSLIFMAVYWVSVAIIKQIKLHIAQGDRSLKWYFLFYYDRPALLIVAFSAAGLFFAVKLILKYNDEKFINQYKKFQKTTLISFTVYYFLVMYYSFFFIRSSSGSSDAVNLIPFKVFEGMKAANFEYELIFLFVGNIAIFLPLGVIVPALLKKRLKILQLAFPFIISIGIEASQYFLGNGQPDIDDVILNVIGFYIGFAAKIILDKLIYKASKGKFNSVFIF